MILRRLTYLFFLLFIGTASSQERIKNIKVEIEYYPVEELPVKFFKAAEDSYQFSFLSGKYKDVDLNFYVRMEDELNSEETYSFLSDVSFFDLRLDHRLGRVEVTWAIENLLNWNNREFAIEGYMEREEGIIQHENFAHESDFLLSTAISYKF